MNEGMRYFLGAFFIVVVILLLFGVTACQYKTIDTLDCEEITKVERKCTGKGKGGEVIIFPE